MTPSGKYFASLRIELPGELPEQSTDGKVIGIDLGLDALIVTSDGDKIKPPKFYRHYEKKLAKYQKRLSRKNQGSANRNKARLKVAKVHNKIANCRLDSHHKLSRAAVASSRGTRRGLQGADAGSAHSPSPTRCLKLVDENQVIVFESLNIKGMTRNHCAR